MLAHLIQARAILSPCNTYRYALHRVWGANPDHYMMVIGLNPSTADALQDDPTIRRCVGFASRLGYEALVMTNLFAYRATDPKQLKQASLQGVDIIGEENDQWLLKLSHHAPLVVAAWGVHGTLAQRDQDIASMIPSLRALKLTKAGHPAHPLYLPYSTVTVPYRER